MQLISLCDNIVDDKKCWASEGASFFLTVDGIRILFDVGRSADVLLHNLAEKGIDVGAIDYVILSHGHKGHFGAIESLSPKLNNSTTIIYGSGIENSKFKNIDGKKASGNTTNSEIIEKIKLANRYMEISEPFQLTENTTLLTAIPLSSDALTAFSTRYMMINNSVSAMDMFAEEIALCVRHKASLFIISGCSHRGIDNIVLFAKSLFPDHTVSGIVGGFHTKNDKIKTDRLISFLFDLSLDIIAPCHCTGIHSKTAIRDQMPQIYRDFTTGQELLFGGDME